MHECESQRQSKRKKRRLEPKEGKKTKKGKKGKEIPAHDLRHELVLLPVPIVDTFLFVFEITHTH